MNELNEKKKKIDKNLCHTCGVYSPNLTELGYCPLCGTKK